MAHGAAEAPQPAGPPLTFAQQWASFPFSFWVANVIELVERFSFYGVRIVAAVYIVKSAEEGGLGLTSTDKGIFFGVWSFIQCILPMFTGGFADRYGYRASLMVAFAINMVGYGLMAFTHSWWPFMIACCLIGTGTAIFKPPLHGTLAHCVTERTSSLGWGIFYQVVNIGAFVGPIVCGYLRLLEWKYAFLAASLIILLNIVITLTLLEDYAKGRGSPQARKSAGQVFAESFAVFREARLVIFLAIFAMFFFMFFQVTDQLPIFVDQWVNSRDVAGFLDWITGGQLFRELFAKNKGQVNPEWLVNVNAGSIILLMLPIAYLAGKFRHILAMIVGMFICCAGFLWTGVSTTGAACALGILIFSIGEMACSPKFSEYVGLMAPPEKKALYMGYSNIPFAFGWAGANFLGGPVYDMLSDKVQLARRYLVEVLGQAPGAVAELARGDVLQRVEELTGKSSAEITQLLWNQYHPSVFWYIYTAVGVVATLALVAYHFWLTADARRRAAAQVTSI